MAANELSFGTGPIDVALRDLAEKRSAADPVVSLYLDTRWNDEHQRERVRLFAQDSLREVLDGHGEGPHRAALETTVARLTRYVDDLCRQAVDEGANGIALFACEGLGLYRRYTFRQPFRDKCAAADIPHLLPLARLAEDFEPVIVALVSAHGARILEMAVGSLVIDETLARQAHRRHNMGGWSQLHYQKHIDRQILRNHKEAAEHLVFLFDETRERAHVVICGPDREVASFERVLPDRAKARVLARLPNPRERDAAGAVVREDLVNRVLERLAVRETESERHLIDSTVGEALAGGLAVLGPEEVVLAANERRIHDLVLDQNFHQNGWRCRRCDALGMRTAISCGFCGGEVTLLDDLTEELVRRVLGADGTVDVVSEPGLAHYHGIGAILRHRGTAGAALGEAAPHP